MSNPKVRDMADVSASIFAKLRRMNIYLESLTKIAVDLDCEISDLFEITKDYEKVDAKV